MQKIIDFIAGKKPISGQKLTVALGVFDGVHPGHHAVIEAAKALAQASGAGCAAVTFVPHPREVLVPEGRLELLMPVSERVKLLLACGADCVGVINFDRDMALWEPEKFFDALTGSGEFEVSGICVGSAWRFGCCGKGDSALLQKMCSSRNISFTAVPELMDNGEKISSSNIRKAISSGNIDDAAKLLGRPCSLYGQVVQGMRVAGRELQAPTANLQLSAGVMPPDGVYAGKVNLADTLYPAVLNIGPAPTYGVSEKRIEVHIIGFDGVLYGKSLQVELTGFLRGIKKFASPEALKNQITADISAAVNKVSGGR